MINDRYIFHFGVKKNKNDYLKINRENYAIINKKAYNRVPHFMIKYYQEHPDERKKIYDDEQCTIYSDSWCLKHREKCLENYDLNMAFFRRLDEVEFNRQINKILNYSKKIKEVYNLNECKDMIGVYILVLDEYKQIYIGQSCSSIKQRIMSHWSKKKEFDRLIFGYADNSILSIDSFGALDTTRIFVYPTCNTYEIEERLVNLVNGDYMLNRTAGGIGSDHNDTNDALWATLAVVINRKTRRFEERE